MSWTCLAQEVRPMRILLYISCHTFAFEERYKCDIQTNVLLLDHTGRVLPRLFCNTKPQDPEKMLFSGIFV
jgi:hypothetical protein